jgi:hypothetical protein
MATCPSCGHELNQVSVASSVKELAAKLEDMDRRGADSEAKENLIKNFPIPNSKEDLLEFFVMAVSQLASEGDKETSKEWGVKIEQALTKAKLIGGDDKKFMDRVNILNSESDAKKKRARRNKIRGFLVTAAIIVAVIFLYQFFVEDTFVKVPKSVTIPAYALDITGDIEGYYQASGDDIVMRSEINDSGTVSIRITFEVEALEDITPEIEKKIMDQIERYDWKLGDCVYSVRFSSDWADKRPRSTIDIGSNKNNVVDVEPVISSLLKMRPGETKKVSISPSNMNKRDAKKLLEQGEIRLNFNLAYKVVNNATDQEFELEIE